MTLDFEPVLAKVRASPGPRVEPGDEASDQRPLLLALAVAHRGPHLRHDSDCVNERPAQADAHDAGFGLLLRM